MDIDATVQNEIKEALSEGVGNFVFTATLDEAGTFAADEMDTSNNAIVLDDVQIIDDGYFKVENLVLDKQIQTRAFTGIKIDKSYTGSGKFDGGKVKAGYSYILKAKIKSPLDNLAKANVNAWGNLFNGDNFTIIDAGAWAGVNIGDFSEHFEG